jgi:hypothetical protein
VGRRVRAVTHFTLNRPGIPGGSIP